MKNYIFVMRHAPHNGIYVQELLDMVLITAAFDQPTALLFIDDGIFQIKRTQQPDVQQRKDTAAVFKALEMYDIKECYTEVESLQERGLAADDLLLPTLAVRRGDVAALMQRYDIVIGG
ncbi:MAG: sulfurtransferase complex subunit TusC [Gammaproteobacteria bacterium]